MFNEYVRHAIAVDAWSFKLCAFAFLLCVATSGTIVLAIAVLISSRRQMFDEDFLLLLLLLFVVTMTNILSA
jgi:hypothetical protein